MICDPMVRHKAYWYNEGTRATVWRRPAGEDVGELHQENFSEELTGSGPVWEMSIQELKEALAERRDM